MTYKPKKFTELSAKQLADFIDMYCLQITKGGYRWRDNWECRVPAPCGHYREEDERTISSGETASDAIQAAYERLNK